MNANPSNSALPLPKWDTNEVQSALDENTVLLNDWEELIAKNEKELAENITRDDINRHNYLKRKLHENLGLMAKMVQSQLKPRLKTETVQANSHINTNITNNTNTSNIGSSVSTAPSVSTSSIMPLAQNQQAPYPTINTSYSQNIPLTNSTSQPALDNRMTTFQPAAYSNNAPYMNTTSTVPSQPYMNTVSTVLSQPYMNTTSAAPSQPLMNTASTVPQIPSQSYMNTTSTVPQIPSQSYMNTTSTVPQIPSQSYMNTVSNVPVNQSAPYTNVNLNNYPYNTSQSTPAISLPPAQPSLTANTVSQQSQNLPTSTCYSDDNINNSQSSPLEPLYSITASTVKNNDVSNNAINNYANIPTPAPTTENSVGVDDSNNSIPRNEVSHSNLSNTALSTTISDFTPTAANNNTT